MFIKREMLNQIEPIWTKSNFHQFERYVDCFRFACTGILNDPSKTYGTLDLGGGSTQITFVPSLKVSSDDKIEIIIS